MAQIQPNRQSVEDFLTNVPCLVAHRILCHLAPSDILRCSQVCRNWRSRCEDDQLWRRICFQRGYNDDSDMKDVVKRLNAVRNSKFGRSNEFKNVKFSIWKLTCRYQSETKRRWLQDGLIEPQKLCSTSLRLKSYEASRLSLAKIGNQLALVGIDQDVRIINLEDDEPQIILLKAGFPPIPHVNLALIAYAMDEDFCVLGIQFHPRNVADHRRIVIFNLRTNLVYTTLIDHPGWVTCLAIKNGICVTGSSDTALRLWNIHDGTLMRVIEAHTVRVFVRPLLGFDGHKIVSCTIDRSLRIWSAETGQCLHVLDHDGRRIISVAYDGVRIVSLGRLFPSAHPVNPFSFIQTGERKFAGRSRFYIRLGC